VGTTVGRANVNLGTSGAESVEHLGGRTLALDASQGCGRLGKRPCGADQHDQAGSRELPLAQGIEFKSIGMGNVRHALRPS